MTRPRAKVGIGVKNTAQQCAVLFVNPERQQSPHASALREIGFRVDEVAEWPDDEETLRNYHAVIVYVRLMNGAPMLAARLRAKPHFGRRLLIALVASATTAAERRSAGTSGFDEVLDNSCDTRHLTGRILRGLRARAELRCLLPRTARPAA